MMVSDVFLNLSFDLPVLIVSPFHVSEQVGSVTFNHALILFVSILKHQVFVFICLKISTSLFADTFSLQSKANCMALKTSVPFYYVSSISVLCEGYLFSMIFL